ncbi:MAG: acyl carrier protein [Clostridiales bacterium]|jgi:acyl carrier protein|nr:acyl carrier protein [Clostridiales bacterium]
MEFEKVAAVIADQLGVDVEKVTAEAVLTDDLGADSLDFVELIMAFEEEFDIEISDEDAGGIKTAGDAAAFIENAKK